MYNEQTIRVLHVIGKMDVGGAETMIMNLYRNIDRTRVQFDFVENSLEPAVYDKEIEKLGGHIYRCIHYNGRNHFLYVKWWKVFFQEHADEYVAVHGHIGSTAAIYLSIAKTYGLTAIAHSHSAGGSKSLMSALYKIYSYNTRYIADYFFACGKEAGIDRFGNKVVLSSRFKVLNNAIDTQAFQYDEQIRSSVRKELLIRDDTLVIGHVGRFAPEKNHTFIIGIFRCIQNRIPNSKLILIGDGDLRPEIERKITELNLNQYVIFTGLRNDVNRLMQAMDVFVLPSKYEGLPVTMVEAQTSGLPCVISDGVPKETILSQDLVFVEDLECSYELWAEKIISCSKINRKSRVEESIEHGYDIHSTSTWLTDFYCSLR